MVERIPSTSLTRYISFARHRLTRAAMASLLPEISPDNIDRLHGETLLLWNREMIARNAALDRARLVQNTAESQHAKQRFSSLDEYVLIVHADKILLVLERLVKFGERVVPLIREDATARAWFLNEHLLIQAHHWRVLARNVMSLVSQLGLLEAGDVRDARYSGICLDDIKLLNAGRRAVEIYGVYARFEPELINSNQKRSAEMESFPIKRPRQVMPKTCCHEEATGFSSEMAA
jgi:hypothetical protein